VQVGHWYHVAGVIDRTNGQMLCYLDGDLQASGTVRTTDTLSTTQPLLIGYSPETWGPGKFAGTLDDMGLCQNNMVIL
jgi:hypothetical protein